MKLTEAKRNKIIEDLKIIAKKYNWSKPEDYYNLTNNILKECGLYNKTSKLITYSNIPSLLFPNYKFNKLLFKRKPNGAFDDFELISELLQKFHSEYGRIPKTTELDNVCGVNIINGIKKHGGLIKISEKLGFLTSSNYLTIDGSNVKSSYEAILCNFLHLNGINYEYEDLISNTHNYKYDFKIGDIYVEIWGMESEEYYIKRRVKTELYRDLGLKLVNLEKELFKKPICDINYELIKVFNASEKFKYKLSELRKWKYFTKDVIIKEMKDYITDNNLDSFPTREVWLNNGFGRHITYLSRNKITFYNISNEFGINTKYKKKGHYDNIDLLLSDIRKLMMESDFTFSQKYLSEKYGSILCAINNHGGMRVIKDILGIEMKYKKEGYWDDFENLKKELLPLCKEKGMMVSGNDLKEKSYLSRAINKHGGFNIVAKKMGFKPLRTKNDYWLCLDNVIKELIPICLNIGRFPTSKQLRDLKRNDLLHAMIRYHNGSTEVKKKIGY